MNRLNIAAWAAMVLCTVIFFTYTDKEQRTLDELQRGIAGNIIRFHVRANSDSDEDQALKLAVKEQVVEYMGTLLRDVYDKDGARAVLSANIENIENIAKGVISGQKKEYNVKAYFENSYFPIKTYGDMTFPAGEYEAFRIDIGAAEGKNWWCVVYPRLCFVDISYGVVTEEGRQELEAVLDEDEFSLICGNWGTGDGKNGRRADGTNERRADGLDGRRADGTNERRADGMNDGRNGRPTGGRTTGTEYAYEFKILRFLNTFIE